MSTPLEFIIIPRRISGNTKIFSNVTGNIWNFMMDRLLILCSLMHLWLNVSFNALSNHSCCLYHVVHGYVLIYILRSFPPWNSIHISIKFSYALPANPNCNKNLILYVSIICVCIMLYQLHDYLSIQTSLSEQITANLRKMPQVAFFTPFPHFGSISPLSRRWVRRMRHDRYTKLAVRVEPSRTISQLICSPALGQNLQKRGITLPHSKWK